MQLYFYTIQPYRTKSYVPRKKALRNLKKSQLLDKDLILQQGNIWHKCLPTATQKEEKMKKTRFRFKRSLVFAILLSLAALAACNSSGQLPSKIPISLADQGAPKGTTATRERFETLAETSIVVDMRTVNDMESYKYLSGAIVKVQHWDSSDELTVVTITTSNGDYQYNKQVSVDITYQGNLMSWCFGQEKANNKCGGVKMDDILKQLNADFGRALMVPVSIFPPTT